MTFADLNPEVGLRSALPPRIAGRPGGFVRHTIAVSDDWAWLRAENWRDVLKDPAQLSDEIRAVLDAENVHADAVLSDTHALQQALVSEMRGRIKEDDSDVPAEDGPFAYYERYREGGEHEILCRRSRTGGTEQIMLDGDRLAKGKAFFSLGDVQVSPDHARLAWTADDKGSEYYDLRIRDLASGKDLPDLISETEGEAVWASDSQTLYTVRLDDNHRPRDVVRHVLGQVGEPALVYREADTAWFVNVYRARSRQFAIVAITDHDSAEAHLLDLGDGRAAPRLIAPRLRGERYEVEPHGDRLFILTNRDAENFKIVEAPLSAPDRTQWRDLVPRRGGCMIVAMTVFRDYLVRLEREAGLPRIVVRHLATGEEHAIAFVEEAYDLSLRSVLEFDTDVLRFAYSSMTTPEEIYDYDMGRRARVLRKRQDIPSGHDAAAYVTRRIFAPAADGEQVPVSLLYARGTPLDGSAPLFITGYGAYGFAYPASFGAKRLSLVDRGFVYAIAHVRGGTDKGWGWYTDGKLANKPNTFGDFIAATSHLVAEGYARKGRVVASGGSAGGMLMGAIANRAPELFAGIIADVPFVDVMNTMLDADLPLTPPEWLEWGNPIEDEAAFTRMLAYSPYDNVSAQTYPAILALGGLTDPRVTYWEPAKWVARLRATMTGGGPVLLRTNMDAGHGGVAGRLDSLKDKALEFAFAIAAINTVRHNE